MCNTSAILGQLQQPQVFPTQYWPNLPALPEVSRAEFDALRVKVDALVDAARAAKRLDEVTGQADCEHGDKVALLKKVAEAFGVDLAGLFQ